MVAQRMAHQELNSWPQFIRIFLVALPVTGIQSIQLNSMHDAYMDTWIHGYHGNLPNAIIPFVSLISFFDYTNFADQTDS